MANGRPVDGLIARPIRSNVPHGTLHIGHLRGEFASRRSKIYGSDDYRAG